MTDALAFGYASGQGRVTYSEKRADDFLQHLLTSKRLTIGSYLKEFEDPRRFFLVAGTGLGKTVALPVFLWGREMRDLKRFSPLAAIDGYVQTDDSPRVWVVEPTIVIAQDLEAELNREWTAYITARRDRSPSDVPPLFGCRTKYDRRHPDAPITFVTTGIFSIFARKGIFRAGRDVVLIDEAHDTLEADEAVELGVGLCGADQVSINFMSATVDASEIPARLNAHVVNIPGKRKPVWKHNTLRPLDECIVELVEKTLVRQDLSSEFFPRPTGDVEKTVRASAAETGRAKGMLVMINSFANEWSDARRIERLLKGAPFASKIEIGLLASEVRRDPKRRAVYEKMLKRWIDTKARYVLIATNVVEKGVTLPDLDFIVTMDSGYDNASDSIGRLKKGALGTNALIQRIGRVGRTRPGIAYITREVGAPYSSLDDETLNSETALKPQSIRFPFETGSTTWLAYFVLERKEFTQSRNDLMKNLSLPSLLDATRGAAIQARARQEIQRLHTLGLTGSDKRLNQFGKLMQHWIGRMDLESAMAAHQAFVSNDQKALVQAICQGALRATSTEPLWNTEALKDTKYDRIAPPALLHVMLDNFGRWMTLTRRRSWISRAWLTEEIVHRLQKLEIKEDRFFYLLRHVKELIDNFVDVVGGLNTIDKNTFGGFLRIRQVVEELPHLRP